MIIFAAVHRGWCVLACNGLCNVFRDTRLRTASVDGGKAETAREGLTPILTPMGMNAGGFGDT